MQQESEEYLKKEQIAQNQIDAQERQYQEDKLKDQQELQVLFKQSVLASMRQQQSKQQIQTQWQLPKKYMNMTNEQVHQICQKHHILVDGKNILPPIENFSEMGFPDVILKILKKQQIKVPFPIQMQGLPIALSGRDSICISPSGMGKTLVYLLQCIFIALEEQIKMAVVQGEGPFSIILIPSHELAIQIFEQLTEFSKSLQKYDYPQIKIMLSIGGTNLYESLQQGKNGFHILVGTPGRISDMLNKQQFSLDYCKFLVLDEADRLLDITFENDLSSILTKFTYPRQTILFSSTMPKTVQQFAKGALNDPLIINVGKQAINLNVVQDIEYVKQEQKITFLLQCLLKTQPQVIIFSDKIQEVDYIHEYLMLKGIKVVSLHGGKKQEDRTQAYRSFKQGQTDVLVATDIAGKGLDFKNIQHVINYDMTKDIESYIHRIGRTGRQGKTGISTTFINKNQEIPILSDLKYLLMEAKQRIPAFLEQIVIDDFADEGCAFCGGRGHKVQNCAKMEIQKMKSFAQSLQQSEKNEIKQYLPEKMEAE